MKKIIIIVTLMMLMKCASSQVKIFGDSTRIYSGRAGAFGNELRLMNASRFVMGGLLVNIDGNGLSKWIRPYKINDTTLVIGLDTFSVGGGSFLTVAVDTIWRTPGIDSIFFKIGGRTHSILDSISTISIVPYTRSVQGITTTSATPQYAQGQKGWFSNTDTISSYYTNSALRSYLFRTGFQTWKLNNGTAECGSFSISTPSNGVGQGVPGILFIDANGKARSQMRLYTYGGLALGAMDSLTTGIPPIQLLVKANSKVFVTGRSGDATTGETHILDSAEQGLFNVYGSGRFLGKVIFGNTTAPSAATNAAQLYSESGELKVIDASGNRTTLSPHDPRGLPGGLSNKMAWSYHSERDGDYIAVDMYKAIKQIEKQDNEIEELKKEIAELKGMIYHKKKPVKLIYTGKTNKK